MKKIILILLLLTAAAPGVSAQKWLKNVGKALEKVDKFLDTSTTSKSSSSDKKTSDKKAEPKKVESPQGEATVKSFPDKCQWHTTTSDDKYIILDLNTTEKEFMIFDIKTHGFIIVKTEYGKDVNAILDIQVDGNSAKLKFVNFMDYNTYGGTLTYDNTDGSVTLSELEMLESSEFGKFLMNIPDEPTKFNRATSPLEYSTEIYE